MENSIDLLEDRCDMINNRIDESHNEIISLKNKFEELREIIKEDKNKLDLIMKKMNEKPALPEVIITKTKKTIK
jgi:uncharacterized coiled-coil DUF342 family protein